MQRRHRPPMVDKQEHRMGNKIDSADYEAESTKILAKLHSINPAREFWLIQRWVY